MARRLAEGSLLIVDDQLELYRRQQGAEAAARQERAARIANGQCVCEPQKVRKRWDGEMAPRIRTVHAADCPKRRPWMND